MTRNLPIAMPKLTNSLTSAKEKSSLVDKRYLWIVLTCTLLMIVAGLLRWPKPFVSVSYYLSFHMIAELSSIVVSFAVFATAWYGYRQTRSLRDLIVTVTFLATALTDTIHTLSYKGMPAFLTPNDAGTAAGYWLLARLLVGVDK